MSKKKFRHLRRVKPNLVKREKRNKYRKGCMHKRRFKTIALAEKFKSSLYYGGGMSIYLCEFCGWYHMGHSDKYHDSLL